MHDPKYILGSLCLAAAIVGSLVLALASLDVVALPGCGAQSACAAAAASRWGTVPLVDWPISFVGLAYFEAMLVAWVIARGRLSSALRAVMWLGAACSLFLLGAMLVEGYLCTYCVGVHSANLAWFVSVGLVKEQQRRRPITRCRDEVDGSARAETRLTHPTQPLVSFFSTLSLTVVVLTALNLHAEAARTELLEAQMEDSLSDLLNPDESCRADVGGDRSAFDNNGLFAPGRYVLGPPDAEHHVVVVSDYQCPACQTIHYALRALMARRNDLSLSARHFPFCTDCNEQIDRTRHQNACRAAQAAEAAGLLGGNDAFWRMHDWLFDRRGRFADEELDAFAAELGLPLAAFRAAFTSDESVDAIRQDARAAHEAGLQFTPIMFLDGMLVNTDAHTLAE